MQRRDKQLKSDQESYFEEAEEGQPVDGVSAGGTGRIRVNMQKGHMVAGGCEKQRRKPYQVCVCVHFSRLPLGVEFPPAINWGLGKTM